MSAANLVVGHPKADRPIAHETVQLVLTLHDVVGHRPEVPHEQADLVTPPNEALGERKVGSHACTDGGRGRGESLDRSTDETPRRHTADNDGEGAEPRRQERRP